MADLKIPDINKIAFAGRIARDPDMRTVGTGAKICSFPVLVSKKFKSKAGDLKEEKVYFEVTAWDKLAEFVYRAMPKGRPVYVEGMVKQEVWDDKTTGQKRNKLVVVAHSVQTLDWEEKATPEPPRGVPSPYTPDTNDRHEEEELPF